MTFLHGVHEHRCFPSGSHVHAPHRHPGLALQRTVCRLRQPPLPAARPHTRADSPAPPAPVHLGRLSPLDNLPLSTPTNSAVKVRDKPCPTPSPPPSPPHSTPAHSVAPPAGAQRVWQVLPISHHQRTLTFAMSLTLAPAAKSLLHRPGSIPARHHPGHNGGTPAKTQANQCAHAAML